MEKPPITQILFKETPYEEIKSAERAVEEPTMFSTVHDLRSSEVYSEYWQSGIIKSEILSDGDKKVEISYDEQGLKKLEKFSFGREFVERHFNSQGVTVLTKVGNKDEFTETRYDDAGKLIDKRIGRRVLAHKDP